MRLLSNWLDSYMLYTDNTEPCDLYRKWAGIHMIAAAMQRKCFLKHGMKTHYPNFYIVLVGRAGRARKGTALEPVKDFLSQPQLNLKFAANLTTKESLIRELVNSADSYMSIKDGLVIHSSFNILSPEFGVFLGFKNVEMLNILTDWYDCDNRWVYKTKHETQEDIVNGVWVNILGAITPSSIRLVLPPEAIGGGLTSRMIFVYAADKKKTVSNVDRTPEENKLRLNLIKDLEEISLLGGEFIKTPEYTKIWEEWYEAQEDNPPFLDEKFDGYLGRRQDFVMKLSMVISASEGDSKILTEENIHRAIEILLEVEKPMLGALNYANRRTPQELLPLIMLDIAAAKEIHISELMIKYSNELDRRGLDGILMTLETMGFSNVVMNTGRIRYNDNFDKEQKEKNGKNGVN